MPTNIIREKSISLKLCVGISRVFKVWTHAEIPTSKNYILKSYLRYLFQTPQLLLLSMQRPARFITSQRLFYIVSGKKDLAWSDLTCISQSNITYRALSWFHLTWCSCHITVHSANITMALMKPTRFKTSQHLFILKGNYITNCTFLKRGRQFFFTFNSNLDMGVRMLSFFWHTSAYILTLPP